LKIQNITIVDLKTPEEWVDTVMKGDIDVVVTAQPYANTVRERLGTNGFFWPVQSSQFLHGLMVSTDNWVTGHPELAVRFIKSIAQAEEYASRNPDKAKAVVQKALNLDAGYIEMVWAQNQFSLYLDQSLLLAMEDEARWMISNNLTAEKTVPDFLDLIYADALKSVKPGAVRIVGK